ncbi:MAG: carbohydrate ABC transporter permease [Fusobacteriaceae bacterium]|nr:carbohydrate ABC transporter permease [Fusobacteriaceae bacterium]MBN2837607.1 carbohydrate ABC transporter permease [Fusobacteriaceae bacterium]
MLTRKKQNLLNSIFMYTLLTLAAIISLFPFYWMIAGATNKAVDITSGKLLPGNQLAINFGNLMKNTNIMQAFINTTKITIIATILTLTITALAAYGFEMYTSKTREKIYKGYLLSMMVPFAALMIPLFSLIVKMNLIDNYWGIIIPTIASAFLVFFFRQNFKAIPKEMIEAARIDGAGEFTIFFKIVLPTMKSTFAAGAIIVFTTHWNNFLWPLIVLQSDVNKTLTLVISSLSSAYFIDYGALMLAIIIATFPVIVIFLTMQKQFVEGMIGSSK